MLTPPRIVSAVCIRVLTLTLWQHCMVLTSVCTTVSLTPSHHALHRDPPKGLRCAQWDALPLSFFPGLIACSVNSGQNYASQCGDMSHLLATLIAPQAASSEKKDVPSKQQDFWNFSKSNFHKALGMSEKSMFSSLYILLLSTCLIDWVQHTWRSSHRTVGYTALSITICLCACAHRRGHNRISWRSCTGGCELPNVLGVRTQHQPALRKNSMHS